VIYVSGLKKIFLSLSVMEDKGFAVTFHRGKLLILPEKDSLETIMVVGVREGTLYRLQGKLFNIWYMAEKTYVSYVIGGWDAYTIGNL
jgi:hypothetical protein